MARRQKKPTRSVRRRIPLFDPAHLAAMGIDVSKGKWKVVTFYIPETSKARKERKRRAKQRKRNLIKRGTRG